MKIKKWDIWWANVKFEEPDEIKKRPVLIINKNTICIMSYKITSINRGDVSPEYTIKDWEGAGLERASFIRFDKPIRLLESDLSDKIGTLQPNDRYILENRLSSWRGL